MASDQSAEVKFEIGHVLFIDIVGYSKLLINQQSEQLETLRQMVRGTEQYRAAEAEGKLLRLPTGDGGALVFGSSPEAPVLCALEISRELKNHPELRVRMGIHSGPVNAVTDLNEQANIAGAGINYAQRVMDCGDAGHILLSRHVAEDLEHYPRWQPHLHDLGQTAVKHGVMVSAVNLYTDDAGNRTVPERFGTAEPAPAQIKPKRSLPVMPIGIAVAIVAVGLLAWLFLPAISRSPSKSLAIAPNEAPIAQISGKTIAVLPFENLSSDKENAYFADGIQDEILTRLAKIAALKVISRTSTQKYKSAPDNLREIGQQLGVANLLEGSVQKAGNAVHINVQLIKAATDAHVWAESYDRELQNIFGVEGEVAGKIADALDAKLTGAEEKALAVRPTNNVDAYNAYLRGRAIEATRYDLPGEAEVGANFQEAVQLDPRFALAWADLTVVRCFLYYNSYDVATNSPAAIKEAANRAMALQPELGESWIAQGDYRRYVLRDYPGALQAYAEAEKRIPNSAALFGDIALVERRMGRWDAAVGHFRKAILLDPRNLQLNIFAGETFGYLRKFAEAEDLVNRALQISTDTPRALMAQTTIFQAEGRLDDAGKAAARILQFERSNLEGFKAYQLFYERRFDDAIALLQSTKGFSTPGSRLEDWQKDFLALLGYCQQLAGKTAEARATYARAIQEIKPTPTSIVPVDLNFFPCELALSHAGLGEKEKALAEARQAVTDYSDDAINKPTAEIALAEVEAQVGDIDAAIAALPHLLEVPAGLTPGILRLDPYWNPLRKDSRFQKLCEGPP